MTKGQYYSWLENNGYEFISYEYDEDAQSLARTIERKTGRKAKLVRERTDTPGLKMFSVWAR